MDNKYITCPAKMDDSRHVTDYRTATDINYTEMYKYNIYRDDSYRMILQNYGNDITRSNWERLEARNNCKSIKCVHIFPNTVNAQVFSDELYRYNNRDSLPFRQKCVNKHYYNASGITNDY